MSTRPSPDSWVELYGDDLFRYAHARLRDRTLAEDLVQETFLAALGAIEDFEGRSSERTWLLAILRHKLVDHFRIAQRERPLSAVGDDDPDEDSFDTRGMWRARPGRWMPDPSALAERDEFWAVFQECLSRLPPRAAEAFALRVMEGLAGEEACKILAVSTTNLGVLLYRARARLRLCLEVKWFSRSV